VDQAAAELTELAELVEAAEERPLPVVGPIANAVGALTEKVVSGEDSLLPKVVEPLVSAAGALLKDKVNEVENPLPKVVKPLADAVSTIRGKVEGLTNGEDESEASKPEGEGRPGEQEPSA
jgi:hypothetical protein